MAGGKSFVKFDWLIILLYIVLVGIGWVNIYSASLSDSAKGFWDFDQIYARQFMFICLSVLLIIFVLAIESKFYERFASVIYIVSLVSLFGLFVFGKTISGATSWYGFGSFSLQPSEFAKGRNCLRPSEICKRYSNQYAGFQKPIRCLSNSRSPRTFYYPTTRSRKRIGLCRIHISSLSRRVARGIFAPRPFCDHSFRFNLSFWRRVGDLGRYIGSRSYVLSKPKKTAQHVSISF